MDNRNVNTRCGACGEITVFRYFQDFVSPYKAFQCSNCRSLSILPTVKMQDDETSSHVYRTVNETRWRRFAKDYFDWVLSHHEIKGSVLDIGCSVGHFVEYGKQLNLPIEGVDIDDKAILIGQQRNLPVYNSMIESLTGSHDLIITNHVFEHIQNGEEFLNKCYGLLSVNGAFVAAMPNYQSLKGRLSNKWIGWCPSQHHWLYSPEGIRQLLTRSGFKVTKIQVRNGTFGYTYSEWRLMNLSLLHYFLIKLSRIFTDAVGMGEQIFVIAHRR